KIVRIRLTLRAQCSELGAPLRDDLVLVCGVLRCGFVVHLNQFKFGYDLRDASLSSSTILVRMCISQSHALLEARRNEIVEIAVEHRLRIAYFVTRSQILDARLVEHITPVLDRKCVV